MSYFIACSGIKGGASLRPCIALQRWPWLRPWVHAKAYPIKCAVLGSIDDFDVHARYEIQFDQR